MEAEMSEITGQPLEENDKALPSDDGPQNDNGKRLTEDLEVLVYVNDDGGIVQVGPNGVPAGVDPASVFPLKIPKSQLKDPNNPLPGLNTFTSTLTLASRRKTKHTPTAYGGKDDFPTFVSSSESSGEELNASIGSTTPEEFAIDQLDPQDVITTIKSVLLEMEGGGTEAINVQNWDQINSNTTTTPTTAPTSTSTAPRPSVVVRAPPPQLKKLPEPRTVKSLPPQPARTPIAPVPSRKISEGDSANIRRSKRQQDRYEKQEADRIREENQQMLQREKEEMKEGKITPLPIVQVPSPAPVTPAPTIAPPPQKVLEKEKSTPGSSKVPKRERKLPAHLNDPNFIKDDPEGIDEGPEIIELDLKDEDFKEEKTGDETGTETEGEAEDIDDPNRLWCICQQPHNNRFMICCDKCEDWFHGKCVNITKAQGKQIEERGDTWVCPLCKKKAREEKLKAQNKKREEMTYKKREPGEILVSPKDPKGAGSGPKKGSRAPGSSTPSVSNPKLSKRPSIDRAGQGRTIKSASNPSTSSASKKSSLPLNDCVVCSKPARPGSVYCGNACIVKHHETTTGLTASPPKKSPTVLSDQQKDKLKQLKRSSSKSVGEEPFLAFHVIKEGTTKSTEVVPHKPKEMTASAILKQQQQQGKLPSTSSPSTPTTSTPRPTLGSTSNDSSRKKRPREGEEETPRKSAKVEEKKSSGGRKESSSSSKETKDKERKNSGDKKRSERSRRDSERREKEVKTTESGRRIDSESLVRENFRKSIREVLKNRINSLSDGERKKASSENSPQVLAERIVEELGKYYGDVSSVKSKSKYRSIYFNLKEEKNTLWKDLMAGSIKPKALVRMEPHEMASAEMKEERQSHQLKELEMIKKSEIEKLAEAKKIELLSSGAEIDKVIVAETETRALDIDSVLKEHHRDKKKDKDDKDKHRTSSRDRERRRSKDRKESSSSSRRSERHKHRHSGRDRKDSSSESRSREKRDRDTSTSKEAKESKDEPKDVKSTVSEEKDRKKSENVSPSTSSEDSSSRSSTSDANGRGKDGITEITDKPAGIPQEVEQELPSSTIKTPDYSDDPAKREGAQKPIFRTKIVMHELGSFNAGVLHCSHNPGELEAPLFPDTPVPVVGRINPETVWDYIDKMKKSKEVIVFRLEPASVSDKEGYMTFFTYLSSRSRLGVLGGVSAPIKDVYLLPLDKHTPIPRALLPFHGPGLSKDRNHSLLAIVTRHTPEPLLPPIPGGMKRRISSGADASTLKKRPKVGGFDIKPGDVQSALSGTSGSISGLSKKESPPSDDDKPYTPEWEDDEEGMEVKEVPQAPAESSGIEVINLSPDDKPPTPDPEALKKLTELEERIARERAEIEVLTSSAGISTSLTSTPITSVASSRSGTSIPGLDGEF